MGNNDLAQLLENEDYAAIKAVAQKRTAKVVRYLSGRLYTEDMQQKFRAVRAFGEIVADPDVFSERKATDLLRRFFWAMNDESGAVPYGVPEAIGEVLAVRPELQPEFLKVLCAMITHEDLLQTGPIERGVMWALGRVGTPVGECSPMAVQGLAAAVANHPDPATRDAAANALANIRPAPPLQTLE